MIKWFWQFLKFTALTIFILYGLKKFHVIDYDVMHEISQSRVVQGIGQLFEDLEGFFSGQDVFEKVEQGSPESGESN